MASSFEQLIFEIIATDKNASAAFDKFRGTVDKTSRSIDDNSKSLDKNAGSLDRNVKSVDKLGESFGSSLRSLGAFSGQGGMGALIAAGAVLSPVLVTLGTGLAGFGLAAYGAIAPVLKAAQATGGLRANMAKLDPEQQQLARSVLALGKQYDTFSKSLQPQVLGVFGQGIQLAGRLMADVQPVAKATGVALESVLGRIDAEFKSGTWQQFFTWMAAQAGPDLQLVGTAFVNLQATLPPLLKLLNPVAVDFLAIVDAGTKLVQKASEVGDASTQTGKHMSSLEQVSTALRLALFAPGVGLYHALQLVGVISKSTGDSTQALADRLRAAHTATADLIHPIGTFQQGLVNAKTATDNEKLAVTQLTTALKGMSTGLLTAQQDQVAWRQAQQAATAAINANTGSLNSNRATALTARAAIIQSTQAALAFANQEVNLHHNTDAASAVIRAQINWLQTHAAHSRTAAAEVRALEAALAALKNKKVTLTETGTGHFSIFGRNTSSTPKLAGGAQGLFIDRGTSATADDVLVRASKGELIVPTKMVQAGAVDHLRGMIPGFAAGGLAGLPGQTTAFDARFETRFTSAMKSAMTSAMRSAIAAAQAAIRASQVHGYGAGVAQWRPDVLRVLRMLGLPLGDAATILSQIGSESGGNPNAINLTDSNAAAGHPSRGLLQTIPSTFAAYRNPSLSSNIYDPLANIYAGVNYAIHRYGNPGFLSVLGHGHGYDSGGWLPPGPSIAYNGTGAPEQVLGPGSMARVEMLLAQILAATRIAPAATSAGTARALNSAARGALGAR